ncbi:tetratricopeptide repeat protein [Stieleria varia]|uniref:Tetratricopeptide repeat protein n=1 Tax=Stieleria varia TaxID=2528005 RepID=A0A5C6AR47_9BACT|nr:tetratricopeptide repeat protein [Stieleria varia]TWU02200.1 hypothetical protein Pla52n_32490 [Stieleria varia]
MSRRLFLSMGSDEFEKPDARFPGFRSAMAAYLRRADCAVKVQEEFRQAVEWDTVEKLAEYIQGCDAVVHLLGQQPGSIASESARKAFLANSTLLGGKEFLADYPELQKTLGDCSDLTYTQWEAFLSIHYSVPLFIYATDDAGKTQPSHIERLKSAGKHAESFHSDVDLFGKLIGDLRSILPEIPELTQRIAVSKFLQHVAEVFLGREAELEFLDGAWDRRINVLSLIAWGGVGKTSLICQWIQRSFIDRDWKDDSGAPSLWRYFDWTFYDQGTGSLDDESANRTGNVGDFFEQALTFFGDPDPKLPGKGTRLAELVRQQHTLLILDGMEPLQAPPNSNQAGQLLDPELHNLLVALAQQNPGLCLISSRQHVRDLAGLRGRAAEIKDLEELTTETAIRLLRKMQITGTEEELQEACKKFDCHALSLTLLGRFLFDAHGGDISRIDRVNLHKADRLTRPERHRTAWGVLEAYDEWLQTHGSDPTLLAVLRLVGLFDRPGSVECLRELRSGDVIAGLTEPIHNMDQDEWNVLLKRLERSHLIRLRPSQTLSGQHDVDAHPLVREYFAEQLRKESSEAFQTAHGRLFDYLCESTEHQPDGIDGLQPLYQAVMHGCLAQRHEEALYGVYVERILRGTGHFGSYYSCYALGAHGDDLRAMASFFLSPWASVDSTLDLEAQGFVFAEAAERLRLLGRYQEALDPFTISEQIAVETKCWDAAAVRASNLGMCSLALGRIPAALECVHHAVEYADKGKDSFLRADFRASVGHAQHMAGEFAEAIESFRTAETLHLATQPSYPQLYSFQGYNYGKLLLAQAERFVWRIILGSIQRGSRDESDQQLRGIVAAELRESAARVANLFRWRDSTDNPLTIGLDYLYRALVNLYSEIHRSVTSLPSRSISDSQAVRDLEVASRELKKSGHIEAVLECYIATGMCQALSGAPISSIALLAEAEQIATRGPMPLYLADIHLTRARLIGSPKVDVEGLNVDVRTELAEARRLIEKHKYNRRMPELLDAEAVLLHGETDS